MQDNLATLGDLEIGTLCIPGSHNSGVSVSQSETFFSLASATKTQTLSIEEQLHLGVRYFDVRPCLLAGKFYTGHYSNLPVVGWQGANSESIGSIIETLNKYTAHHRELIIVNLSHAFNVNSRNFTGLSQEEWNLLFENMFVAPKGDVDLSALRLRDYIGNNKSAVVFVVDASESKESIDLEEYAGRGIYPVKSLNLFDRYSETNDIVKMAKDQVSKMRANSSSYFLLSWTLTQNTCDVLSSVFNRAFCRKKDSHSVLSLAAKANAILSQMLLDLSTAKSHPNVISVDNVTESLNLHSLVMKINSIARQA